MSFKFQKLSFIDRNKQIHYTDINFLKLFVTEQGKILPSHLTGVTAQQQRQITKAIKRARTLALLPFLTSNIN